MKAKLTLASIILVAFLHLFMVTEAMATVQDFRDEAEFLAAAPFGLEVESFEGLPADNGESFRSTIPVDDFTLQGVPHVVGQGLSVFDDASGGSHATDGTKHVLAASVYHLHFDLDRPAKAFGINVIDWGDFGSGELIFKMNDEALFTIAVTPLSNANVLFFGVISTEEFNRVTLSHNIYGEAYSIDEVYYRTTCPPPCEPNNPVPYDGAENVPVDTCLSWDGCLAAGPLPSGRYRFVDSDQSGGPSFNDYWTDISESGTNLNLGDDTYFFPINLPFNFDFYGTEYNQVAVSSNGSICFEDTYMGCSNTCIPGTDTYGIDSFIAVYWDDLVCSATDNVYSQVVGSPPSRRLIVQWENVRHFGSTDRFTFQAQLFEASNEILLLYADPSLEAGSGATVGIQGDATHGLQYLCNEAKLHSDLAVLFTGRVCPITWDLYFGTNANELQLIATDINESNYCPCQQPCGLQTWTQYYWQVIAKNADGQTPGPIWSFKTECPVDLNHNGIVDVDDLDIFIGKWLDAICPITEP